MGMMSVADASEIWLTTIIISQCDHFWEEKVTVDVNEYSNLEL